ncbi:MAG: hypothetical protein IJ957_00175, partial [Rikenellaceae bacterium]|nr:hypothetical protein [Rikenellaceae bacterium]
MLPDKFCHILFGRINRNEAGIIRQLTQTQIGNIRHIYTGRTGSLREAGNHLADDTGTVDHAGIAGIDLLTLTGMSALVWRLSRVLARLR